MDDSPNSFDVTEVLAGLRVPSDDPRHRYFRLLLQCVEQNPPSPFSSFEPKKLKDHLAGRQIVALSRSEQVSLIEAAVPELRRIDQLASRYQAAEGGQAHFRQVWYEIWGPRSTIYHAIAELMRKKLPFDQSHLRLLMDWVAEGKFSFSYCFPLTSIVKAAEAIGAPESWDDETSDSVRRLIKALRAESYEREIRKLIERLEKTLGTASDLPIQAGEAWSDAAISDLESDPSRDVWTELLLHCKTASAGKPSQKWLKTADTLIAKLGVESFRAAVARWFPRVDQPRTAPADTSTAWLPEPDRMIIEPHADILKGLVWCCGQLDDEPVARLLTELAISTYKKIPGIGPRAVKIGNACVYALGAMGGLHGVSQLALLKVRVKFGTAQKGIEKALLATAAELGIERDELEEMAVPSYGLTEVGKRLESIGEFTAELSITGRKSELTWRKSDGKLQKSVPAVIKRDFAEELKELKQASKDIEKMLPAQAARIEQCYLRQNAWSFPVWSERYLNHPLMGTLVRGLIWNFESTGRRTTAIWHQDGLVDHEQHRVEGLDDSTQVRLWHPLDASDAMQIVAWRDWLEEHQVRQPFKQAHREIYLLTDAERSTRVYSNRFAAHILRQHQFNALCAARHWKNSLRLMVDDAYPPATIELPQWGLRAEFWIEGAGDEFSVDTNETGTYLYLATDQVRFYPAAAAANWAHATGGGYSPEGRGADIPEPLELDKIPPLVFSEVMRDVDLFVGVASVGNDPTWADGGPEGRYQDYWNRYSFGELSGTATTRKTVLERLIPKLKISNRCSFADRFLVVRGDIRTYRIHLGSGNILMEPNNEYLCIVPKQSVTKGTDQVFLPFEGDTMMSVILSKAMLLADDTKIKDPTIVHQIQRLSGS